MRVVFWAWEICWNPGGRGAWDALSSAASWLVVMECASGPEIGGWWLLVPLLQRPNPIGLIGKGTGALHWASGLLWISYWLACWTIRQGHFGSLSFWPHYELELPLLSPSFCLLRSNVGRLSPLKSFPVIEWLSCSSCSIGVGLRRDLSSDLACLTCPSNYKSS